MSRTLKPLRRRAFRAFSDDLINSIAIIIFEGVPALPARLKRVLGGPQTVDLQGFLSRVSQPSQANGNWSVS